MIKKKITSLLYLKVTKPVTYCYVALINLSYVVVQVHTPLAVNSAAVHDDALYISLGRSLAEGRWLGAFNEFTLVKGPGYAVYLALSHWLGMPVSLAHALFHCGAITCFVAVVHRMIRSLPISGVLLALLVWHPISMTVYLLRAYRDVIYPGQVLLLLASLIWTFFWAGTRQKCLFALLSGMLLGWLWLSREEGLWIVPALIFLIAVAAYRTIREAHVCEFTATLAILVGTFAAIQVGFYALNWRAYGSFVGVDVKEANFQRALGAIHSVRSGGTKPFVSITHAAREQVYKVSPAFASLASYFEGPGLGWAKVSCDANPISCGDIGSGWFMWALRDATAGAGRYATPAEASAFFGQLADEISTACIRGNLECSPQFISDMPPITWYQIVMGFWQRAPKVLDLLILREPPLQAGPSTGTRERLAKDLRFLNYPTHTHLVQDRLASHSYSLWGWYYKSGREWFRVRVKGTDGSWTEPGLNRKPSPDIQRALNDATATDQRFSFRTQCSDQCVIQFLNSEGISAEKSIVEMRRAPIEFQLGSGQVFIDTVETQENPAHVVQRSEEICEAVRKALLTRYNWFFIPVLVFGIIAFVVSTFWHWKQCFSNTCYILAFTSWMIVVLRASFLTLIDVTIFPALLNQYMAPAYVFLSAGAILSLAAWLQLSSWGPDPHENAQGA